jgi:Tfp pilus assembly protein FimT
MVELLVVLAILSSIILIALPDYLSTILPEHRIKAAARDVMTDMRFARMRSVSRNLEYRIVITPGSDSYVIEAGNRSSGSTAWSQDGPTREFSNAATRYFHQQVSIEGGGTTTSILYKPIGTVTPAPTVNLSHPKAGNWAVNGSIAGKVKLIKG